MKRDQRTIVVFFLMLGALLAGTCFSSGKVFSEREKRYLADKPEWSFSSLLSGAFMDDTDAWLADHVGGKEELVFLKTMVERLEGRTLLNGVYYKDGSYWQHYEPDPRALEKTLAAWEAYAEAAAGVTDVYILPVPLNSEIYPERLPAAAAEERQEETFAEVLRRMEGRAVVLDCRERLRAEKERYLYFRTDHHWTMEGAYLGAGAFLSAVGEGIAPREDFRREILNEGFYGTLYAKAPALTAKPDELVHMFLPGVTCEVSLGGPSEARDGYLVREEREGRDPYSVFFGGNYGFLTIKNTSEGAYAGEGRLLVIKDSYANCLLPFLIPYYEEIDVIDPRHYMHSVAGRIADGGYSAVLVIQEV
ncbi:MAG: hypothetical protein HFI93_07100 [Lachnospiraceae bacterium]|nr:hypothetical protein [Lachnospiraceae bacterium]